MAAVVRLRGVGGEVEEEKARRLLLDLAEQRRERLLVANIGPAHVHVPHEKPVPRVGNAHEEALIGGQVAETEGLITERRVHFQSLAKLLGEDGKPVGRASIQRSKRVAGGDKRRRLLFDLPRRREPDGALLGRLTLRCIRLVVAAE